ncbi:MAG: C25 family cysteine peptidase [Candidatus Cloacimonadaceae bacterium]
MKKWFLMVLVLLPLVLAAVVSVDVQIPQWNLTDKGQDGLLPLIMEPGNPALPFYPVKVLLPMGEKISEVRVALDSAKSVRNSVYLDFVRTPQPISQPAPDLTQKNLAVWNADAFYPAQDYALMGTQQWKGYTLAVINVYPWQYNPVTKQLTSAGNAVIEIITSPDSELRFEQDKMLIVSDKMRRMLEKTVVNPELMSSYTKTYNHTPMFRDLNPNDPKKMIIVTSQNKITWFNQYMLWKSGQSIPTGIFAIEDILSTYTGTDNPAKLRSFIHDAFLTWGGSATPLEYVILAGDDEIIPVRGLVGQVGDTYDSWMPSDLYYAGLDGDWNADGDNLWGEYPIDNPDLVPEVYVGRFPAETQAEFDNIMNKTMHYVNNVTFSNNIAFMFGENLNWNPVTWGGDYKDDVAQYIPAGYHVETFYQRDGNYSPQIVINAINSGAGIMNHMGHANETFLMGQSNGTVEALYNTEYGFLYSQGCYPAAFDQRTSGDGESIGEHLVTASGALYAFIGNTRYGWYMPGSINGPSQYFDRQFFNGMFQQGMFDIGSAMEYSLLQNLNNAMQSSVMLWCYYETILFGDPSTEVKLPNPDLSYLNLEDYYFDDVEGDDDGNLNPGEAIRLYTRVKNLEGWNTAYNVTVTLENVPAGVILTNNSISVPQLASGAYMDSTLYIRLELPSDMAFGTYNFTIKLAAYDAITNLPVCERSFPASMDITLLDSHFPWDWFYAGKSAPVVGDLQFNDENQILFVDVNGDGHFINTVGQKIGGFEFNTEENINRSFAVGVHELINTPMHTYAFTSRTGKIYAIAHKDTTTINYINYDTGSTLLFTPVIVDLDNNGLSEVIAAAHNRNIYALNYDNQLLSGFPVELTAAFGSELAVADLDNNGTMEIIAGTVDGKLWVIEHNGTVKTGFPVQLNGIVTGSPIVLDNNKIVIGTRNNLYVVSAEGTILTQRQIVGDIIGGAIAVDIERNGELDIVFVATNGMLYACRQDGSDINGFPVNTGTFVSCPPLAADIDGDLQYEIIVQNHLNSVYIYNHDGSMLTGFPFNMNFNGSTPATLTDFDEDGNYDLISGYSNGVLVIKLRRALGTMNAWTVYRGSLSRQASFAATDFVSNQDETAVSTILLSANYPNPFNPETTISFTLPKAEQNVNLIIYNSKGQKVRTLLRGSSDKGETRLVWNGKDDNGRAVGSGIYFYRLNVAGESQSRKMLLLK